MADLGPSGHPSDCYALGEWWRQPQSHSLALSPDLSPQDTWDFTQVQLTVQFCLALGWGSQCREAQPAQGGDKWQPVGPGLSRSAPSSRTAGAPRHWSSAL